MLSQIERFFDVFYIHILDADRIPVVLAAILLTLVMGIVSGSLAGNANPLIIIIYDTVLGRFGERLDRLKRTPADLMFRGFLLTALAIFLALIMAKYSQDLALSMPYHGLTETLILSCLLTSGAVWFATLRLYFALEGKKAGPGAYYAIARSTRTNLSIADNYAITRVSMGFCVRSFDKGLVSPVFWYLIAGLPAIFVYSALVFLVWRFGKDGFTKGFGAIPLILERLMGFIPNYIAGLLVILAALFTPTAGLLGGIISWFGFQNRAPYAQGGAPLSALAWALNVSLGGASQDLSGSAIKGVWVGPEKATAQNDFRHLRRALYITVIAHVLFIAILCAIYMWAGLGPARWTRLSEGFHEVEAFYLTLRHGFD